MTIFTAELGDIVDSGFNLELDKYPIFDEKYRSQLNLKIINHYRYREIGLETPGLFRFFLNRKMNEIMPFYNQVYESTLLEFNPLTNYDVKSSNVNKTEHSEDRTVARNEEANNTASTVNDSSTDSSSRNLVSATPQMQLSGHDDYATNLADTKSETKVGATGTQSSKATNSGTDASQATSINTDDYVGSVGGITGMTNSAALMQFRQAMLNVDMMVVEELQELFMGIYTDYWNGL